MGAKSLREKRSVAALGQLKQSLIIEQEEKGRVK